MLVEIHGVQSRSFGSEYVRLEIVAYHQSSFALGTASGESIVEELFRRLVGTSVFAEDYRVERVLKRTGTQFLVLHLVETVRTEMQSVTALSQMAHKTVSTLDDATLARAEVKKLVADLEAIFLV